MNVSFDPSKREDITRMISAVNEVGTMLVGKNEYGQDVFFNVAPDDGRDCLVVDTFQSNGWVRKNIYHLNGEVEELYSK